MSREALREQLSYMYSKDDSDSVIGAVETILDILTDYEARIETLESEVKELKYQNEKFEEKIEEICE